MAIVSGIAWTRSTFNPWIGCTKVGPGCDHCYAENQDSRKRWGGATHWGPGTPRHRTSASNWKQPPTWNRKAQAGEFWPVFCASLADVFDNEVPDEWRADLFRMIEATPALTWQLVTKRIGNVMRMVPESWRNGFPPNVWQLATIVDNEELERDGPKLVAVPAVVRGVSYEPALEQVDWSAWLPRINWIIVGGESAQSAPARPFNLAWARDTITQCRRAGVAVFVKQLGSTHGLKDRAGADPMEWSEDLRVREFPNTRSGRLVMTQESIEAK